MAELAETQGHGGLTDAADGAMRLTAEPWRPLASVQPFRGKQAEVETALGASLPGPGLTTETALSLALDQWLIEGDAADLAERLQGFAAVTDQSDAWSFWRVFGEAAAATVARLAPFDPSEPRYSGGACVRTQLARHPGLVVIEPGAAEIRVACPRSYAASFAKALREAALG